MNDNFDLMCRALGWGDPRKGLWFIGMEEAGVWRSQGEIEEFKQRKTLRRLNDIDEPIYIDSVDPENRIEHVSGGRRRSQIQNMQSYIAMNLSDKGPKSTKAYRDNKLWTDGSGVFQSNLFPLGKAKISESLPGHYKELFGYGPSDHAKYVVDSCKLRFRLLRQFRISCQPQAVVCFGKGFWPYAAELFELGKVGEYEKNLGFFSTQRVVLTPFLGQGMSYDQANIVVRVLSDWGVRLP